MRKAALIVAGLIFSLIALMHLLRIIFQIQILVAGYLVPMLVSILGFVITVLLAYWMFKSAAK